MQAALAGGQYYFLNTIFAPTPAPTAWPSSPTSSPTRPPTYTPVRPTPQPSYVPVQEPLPVDAVLTSICRPGMTLVPNATYLNRATSTQELCGSTERFCTEFGWNPTCGEQSEAWNTFASLPCCIRSGKPNPPVPTRTPGALTSHRPGTKCFDQCGRRDGACAWCGPRGYCCKHSGWGREVAGCWNTPNNHGNHVCQFKSEEEEDHEEMNAELADLGLGPPHHLVEEANSRRLLGLSTTTIESARHTQALVDRSHDILHTSHALVMLSQSSSLVHTKCAKQAILPGLLDATAAPTYTPTRAPTPSPTRTPTFATPAPTPYPTPSPTQRPITTPSPTRFPTRFPTRLPTRPPTPATRAPIVSFGHTNGASGTNHWDAAYKFDCPANQAITKMTSSHSNHREDRKWHFTCNAIVNSGGHATLSNDRWGGFNGWDGTQNQACGTNEVMTGIWSDHSNGAEDRRYRIKCSRINRATIKPFQWSQWANGWDGNLDYTCQRGMAMTAMYSVHSNGAEDRRFKFKCGQPQ